ncbi:MAG TPA: restriction endonuclease subunit S [Agriterribacter sp.]|nr:restriction endonuclease subunit S [Agriterribacter sp.]
MIKEDWIECRLEEVVQVLDHLRKPINSKDRDNRIKGKTKNELYPYYGATGKVGYINDYLTDGEFVLIGEDAAPFYNPIRGLAYKIKGKTWVNNHAHILKPKIVQDYVLHYLNQFNYRGYVSGTTRLKLTQDSLRKIPIDLCSLPEQRAIVKKIEQLFSALDAGIADVKKAQEQLNVYRQAVLKKAFEGELTKKWRKENKVISACEFLTSISKARLKDSYKKGSIYHKKLSHDFKFNIDPNISTWARGTLDKLVYIAARIGWRGLKKDEYKKEGPLFLSVHSLNHGKYVDYSEAFHLSIERYKESPEIQLKEGDVLLCKDGAGIGKLGIVKNLPNKATVNSSVLVIRGMEILNQEFLYYLFLGPDLQKIVFERITGSATPHLFQNDIRQFELSIPPPEEQLQIVKEIESRLSVCDALEQQINTSLQQAEALRQSILKKAFAGELLTEAEIAACKKESDYEPASVLLGRIKKDKDKTKTSEKPVKEEAKPVIANIPKVSADIHAGLIGKIIKLHEASPDYKDKLSHVKCEKIAHLVEYHVRVPLGRHPVKDAAGPDDYRHLKNVESRAIKAGFFKTQKTPIGYTYIPGNNIEKVIDKFESSISDDQNAGIDKLLQLFLPFDLETAEIAATTYAGWNNLIISGNCHPSDEEIVTESRENWSERKLGISRERFFKAINWMRQKEISLIPTGYGLLVSAPAKKKK